MTDEELARLEALAAAATPGPWLNATMLGPTADGEYPLFGCCCCAMASDNGAFVVAAREAVPALIAEVRRLRDEQRWSPSETRRCDYCGKLTRITTAGCDHCDVEDK